MQIWVQKDGVQIFRTRSKQAHLEQASHHRALDAHNCGIGPFGGIGVLHLEAREKCIEVHTRKGVVQARHALAYLDLHELLYKIVTAHPGIHVGLGRLGWRARGDKLGYCLDRLSRRLQVYPALGALGLIGDQGVQAPKAHDGAI